MVHMSSNPRASCRTAGSVAETLEGRLFLHAGHVHDAVASVAATAEEVHVRINAGGKPLVDANGNTWERDRYARGGKAQRKRYDVAGTVDDALFAQVRTGKFLRYALPLPAGTYTLNLLFADPKFTAAGKRVFDVTAEGVPMLSGFDVAANGGGRSAIGRSFAISVADGSLNLEFRGVVGKAIVSAIQVFQGESPAPAPTGWQAAASTPLTLFEAQGVSVADRIYVFGGFHNGQVQVTTSVIAYDPATNTWAPRTSMPVAVTHGGVAVDGSTVWIVGGLLGDYSNGDNPPTRDTWRYDTLTDTWAPGPRLPAATGAGGTAILGRELHYFGGFAPDGQGDSSKHYVLNLDAAADPAAAWATAASMPIARNHFGTAVVNGRIYAVGGQHGRDETHRNVRDVHVYDPQTNRWSTAAKLPRPMSHFHNSTVVVNNRILIAGGVTNGRYPLTDTWEYDPATNQWAASLPLPAPRKAPVAVIAAGALYVLTGSPGDNFPKSDVWFRAM